MFSIIFGTLASVLPNLFFAWLYFLLDARAPKRFIKFIFLNEGLKFVGVALLVSAFLQWPSIQTNKFFSAFLVSEAVRFFYYFLRLARNTM